MTGREVPADIVGFADWLATVEIPSDYRRNGQEYRDFRAALVDGTAGPAQARRVLTRIFHWGGLFAPVAQDGDPYATHVRAGAQQLCQRILMALNTLPETESEDSNER